MCRWNGLPSWLGVLTCLGLAMGFGGCQHAADPWKDSVAGQPRILASFPPLYCFAANVAGPDAMVKSVVTVVGPHEFSPRAQDVIQVRGADLFLVNGLRLDNFFEKMIRNSGSTGVKVVALGEAIPKERLLELGEAEHEHGHDHGHHHEGSVDPHVWLGIPEAVLMVERIRDELQAKDPAHAEGYRARAAAYVDELKKLQEDGKAILAGKMNRKIIATHDSLGYFARAFGLELEGSIQPRPGVDADANQMAKLVDLCLKQNVRVIAVEPQYSKATAETLGKQLHGRGLHVEVVEVDPMETVADGKLDPGLYVRKMRENINNLAKQLP